MLRKSAKSIVPEPSLSMSAIIFLISSFFGSKPSALMATCGNTALNMRWLCNVFIKQTKTIKCTSLQLLHVYSSGSVRVKKIESLLNFLPLLVCQLNLGSSFLPLTDREDCFTVARSLGSNTRRGYKSSLRPHVVSVGKHELAAWKNPVSHIAC